MIRPNSRAHRELARFIKFSIVGAFGAVVDFGTFNLLTLGMGVWGPVAQAFSFSAAITSNFLWNRYWTYPDSRVKSVPTQALQFAFVNLIGLLIRTPIFTLGVEPLTGLIRPLVDSPTSPFPMVIPVDSITIGRNLALALAIVVVLFWNFAVNRFWTYSDAM